MAELVEAGKVTPVIGRTYPLTETPEAIRELEKGHARRQARHSRVRSREGGRGVDARPLTLASRAPSARCYTCLVPTYVALLRGINVGGKNLIKMPALKAASRTEGSRTSPRTSRAATCCSPSSETRNAALTDRIEAMLAEAFDYVPTVVVRSRKQMRAIVDRAPKGFGTQPAKYRYDVIFLKEPLTAKTAIKGVPTNPAVDAAHAGTGVLYFSRLTAKATASRLSKIVSSPIYPSVTIRNWNTTTKLLSMMDAALLTRLPLARLARRLGQARPDHLLHEPGRQRSSYSNWIVPLPVTRDPSSSRWRSTACPLIGKKL